MLHDDKQRKGNQHTNERINSEVRASEVDEEVIESVEDFMIPISRVASKLDRATIKDNVGYFSHIRFGKWHWRLVQAGGARPLRDL